MTTAARVSLEKALLSPNYVDVTTYPGVQVLLAYGTTKNLLNVDVYGGFQRALLHKIAAEKFAVACALLQKKHPGLFFIVFDALRPQSAQEAFWNLVKNTPQEPYFANPIKGSLHSYGFAIDLGLVKEGKELPMGTSFDDLTPLAEPRQEEKFLQSGELSAEAYANRKILRAIMTEAGFAQLPHEWWHYDALPGAEVRQRFERLL